MPDESPKRGAIPSPRSVLAAATPHRPLIGAPANFIMKPARISMWGNSTYGDCVTAEEAFAKACSNPEIFISDYEAITWASEHGFLNGAMLTNVMTTMQSDGFEQESSIYNDGLYLSVEWTDAAILQSAISSGPVKIGVAADQIEKAWHTTNGASGWVATGFTADPNEDHCVSLCGYGSMSWLAQQLGFQVPIGNEPGYAMFTWNSIGIIDVPSMINVTHEAWLRQPTTVAGVNHAEIPIYQHKATDPDRFFLDRWIPNDYGWSSGAELFRAFANQESGTAPIYQHNASNPDRYFYDSNPNGDSGWSDGSVVFYAFSAQAAGTIPIYQHKATDPDRFFLSTQQAGSDGWSDGGVICYAFPT